MLSVIDGPQPIVWKSTLHLIEKLLEYPLLFCFPCLWGNRTQSFRFMSPLFGPQQSAGYLIPVNFARRHIARHLRNQLLITTAMQLCLGQSLWLWWGLGTSALEMSPGQNEPAELTCHKQETGQVVHVEGTRGGRVFALSRSFPEFVDNGSHSTCQFLIPLF